MADSLSVFGGLVVDNLDRRGIGLAARRTSPPDLAGRWEFPDGKVEPGESPPEALRRELAEELGIGIDVGEELVAPGGGAWPISEQYELRLFHARVATGSPTPGESHDEVRWVAPDGLSALDWLDSDRAALPFVFGRRTP